MPVIACTNTACGKPLSIPDALRGKMIRCPHCATTQKTPAAAAIPVAELAPPPAPAPLEFVAPIEDIVLLPDDPTARPVPQVIPELTRPRPRRESCPWCEAPIDPRDRFCPECGRGLDTVAADIPYPSTVRTAGIIWIVFGGIIMVNLVILLGVTFLASSETRSGAVLGAGMCSAILVGLFGAAFLFVGLQSVHGTARDTLGNGIGSIILGLLVLGSSLVQFALGQTWQPAIGILECGGLLTAGVLALKGREDYRRWKRANRPPPRRGSRRDRD